MSIYEFLKENIGKEGYGSIALPDCDSMSQEERRAWVPGAFEGILLRSDYKLKQSVFVNYSLARSAKKQILHPSEENAASMEKKFLSYSAIAIADALLSILTAFKIADNDESREAARREALRLATKTDKRELVKIGIAMLGQWGRREDTEIFNVLGCHNEFTLYAAAAVKNILHEGELNSFLKDIASVACGWGKIAVMYELDYSQEDIRYYTVSEGCYNTVGLSYTANLCAIKGGMLSYLKDFPSGDRVLFKGVCDIFSGLLENDAVNDGIAQYTDAYEASRLFKELCEREPELVSCDARTKSICSRL